MVSSRVYVLCVIALVAAVSAIHVNGVPLRRMRDNVRRRSLIEMQHSVVAGNPEKGGPNGGAKGQEQGFSLSIDPEQAVDGAAPEVPPSPKKAAAPAAPGPADYVWLKGIECVQGCDKKKKVTIEAVGKGWSLKDISFAKAGSVVINEVFKGDAKIQVKTDGQNVGAAVTSTAPVEVKSADGKLQYKLLFDKSAAIGQKKLTFYDQTKLAWDPMYDTAGGAKSLTYSVPYAPKVDDVKYEDRVKIIGEWENAKDNDFPAGLLRIRAMHVMGIPDAIFLSARPAQLPKISGYGSGPMINADAAKALDQLMNGGELVAPSKLPGGKDFPADVKVHPGAEKMSKAILAAKCDPNKLKAFTTDDRVPADYFCKAETVLEYMKRQKVRLQAGGLSLGSFLMETIFIKVFHSVEAGVQAKMSFVSYGGPRVGNDKFQALASSAADAGRFAHFANCKKKSDGNLEIWDPVIMIPTNTFQTKNKWGTYHMNKPIHMLCDACTKMFDPSKKKEYRAAAFDREEPLATGAQEHRIWNGFINRLPGTFYQDNKQYHWGPTYNTAAKTADAKCPITLK